MNTPDLIIGGLIMAGILAGTFILPHIPRKEKKITHGGAGLLHEVSTMRHLWVLCRDGQWRDYDPETGQFVKRY